MVHARRCAAEGAVQQKRQYVRSRGGTQTGGCKLNPAALLIPEKACASSGPPSKGTATGLKPVDPGSPLPSPPIASLPRPPYRQAGTKDSEPPAATLRRAATTTAGNPRGGGGECNRTVVGVGFPVPLGGTAAGLGASTLCACRRPAARPAPAAAQCAAEGAGGVHGGGVKQGTGFRLLGEGGRGVRGAMTAGTGRPPNNSAQAS